MNEAEPFPVRRPLLTSDGAARGQRPFPAVGVVLVGSLIALGIIRELLAPPASHHTRPLGILLGVLLDVAFLTWLSRRIDAQELPPTRALVVTLGANALIGVSYWLAIRGVLVFVIPYEPARLREAAWGGLLWSIEIFALWAVGFHHPELARTARLRALEADRLREDAELARLRGHLQPHFLRNTLNAVAALVTEDPPEARRLLATLGNLLCEVLVAGPSTHTIGDEIMWLRGYGEIFAARHRGALAFVWDVPPEALHMPILTLILQPLVENAVLHGALCRNGDGQVAVRVSLRVNGGVVIAVEDNGPGMPAEALRREGLGLRLVRRRLAVECPGSRLSLESSAQGTRAVVNLP